MRMILPLPCCLCVLLIISGCNEESSRFDIQPEVQESGKSAEDTEREYRIFVKGDPNYLNELQEFLRQHEQRETARRNLLAGALSNEHPMPVILPPKDKEYTMIVVPPDDSRDYTMIVIPGQQQRYFLTREFDEDLRKLLPPGKDRHRKP